MSGPATERQRVRVDGKFFRLGAQRFCPKGVTYGPFAPDVGGSFFATPEQTARDLDQIRQLGANLLRVYYVPPPWFLDIALAKGLRVLVDIPWSRHRCFLESAALRAEACDAVRNAALQCAGHPAVFALSVVNEVPADIVRWSGASKVAKFIDELVNIVKEIDPECPCTFGNFPPTEFLRPQNIDFHCFNVYLHNPKPFENYVARLQMIADAKPLVLGEFGVDSMREGEERQAEILRWKIELSFRGGAAGAVVYSFTDDWFKGGQQIEDWAFGLTTRSREPKQAFTAVREMFQVAPYFPLGRYPTVSVVVASYNGARTLQNCLESLQHLNYPSYEVILVDDGSTDNTAEIARSYPKVRTIRHTTNLGLSVARNSGIEAAEGEVIAFTDSDCRPDGDWLYYLVGDLVNSEFAGIGGHNLLPPEDSWVAAAVMVSPGGPAHVMLTDRIAEHIPGCNMAFYKWALQEISGFDPLFRKAGDDVDICWRLQQHGYKIGFSPGGFVWHYRRSAVRDYLKQQRGYGEAEAMLVHRHPEYFNWYGTSQWQGRIYSPAKFGVVTRSRMIYHGTFGSGFFQTLYTAPPALGLMLVTSLEYHVLVLLPLVVASAVLPLLAPLAITAILVPLVVCSTAAAQADLSSRRRTVWSRPLVALLFFLQPIVRGWARYQGRLSVQRRPLAKYESLDSLSLTDRARQLGHLQYWDDEGVDRIQFLQAIMRRLDERDWPNKMDLGWNNFDLEIYGSRWSHLQVITVAEVFGSNRQLIRCRLRTAWTLFAQTIFWGLTGTELLLIGFFGRYFPSLWMLLLSLPLLIWWLTRQQHNLQRLMTVFLDDVAKEVRLTKVQPQTGARSSTPPRPAPPVEEVDRIPIVPPSELPAASAALAAVSPSAPPRAPRGECSIP
jgi:glycosyltransferase involved in cell wall biosynthesis